MQKTGIEGLEIVLPGPGQFFLLFMDFRFFFFLVLLKLCRASSTDETSEAPKKVFSYFSQLLTEIKRNPSFLITYEDYYKINDLYRRFPLDCMLSLDALDDIQLIYLTCLVLGGGSYFNLQDIFGLNLFGVNRKFRIKATVLGVFKWFNGQILDKLRKNFTRADSESRKEDSGDENEGLERRKVDLNDRKKLVCAMLSLLQQISFSSESFLDLGHCYGRKIYPRTYIQIMTSLIEAVEMDFVAGAYETFLQLQDLSKSHAGKIPTQGLSQQRIFTLVSLFHFYSHHIYNFSPTSLNLNLCTPEFLALLVMSSRYATWEEIFSFFISDNVIYNAKEKLYWNKISFMYRKHRLNDDTHASTVLSFPR